MIQPDIDSSVFIAPGAVVLGNTTLSKDCSVWYNATIRADREKIIIGAGSNIQDNCVIHVDEGCFVTIGEYVTIGHGCIIHGCRIGNQTVIGMGSILLNGAKIGNNCLIGAGTLITQETIIPDNSLVLGSPGKIIRNLTREESASNLKNAMSYMEEARFMLTKEI